MIEQIGSGEWAAPIVCVPKKNGKIRICGDYKATVNSALDKEQYPLPRPEDIFAKLASGKSFMTLDLTNAYNQLLLDDDSQEYVTVNTHRGLYCYKHLPFGVCSLPKSDGHYLTGHSKHYVLYRRHHRHGRYGGRTPSKSEESFGTPPGAWNSR